MKSRPSVFLSVGELSGELIALEMLESLQQSAYQWDCYGISGPKLERAGVKSWYRYSDLSVMGILDVLGSLNKLAKIQDDIIDRIQLNPPHLAVLVDYPGFHFQLAEKLAVIGIPVVQLMAPKLWAWGGWRAYRLRRDFDFVAGILPFEKDFFARKKVDYLYIGSPILERVDHFLKGENRLTRQVQQVAILPGSRPNEIRRHLPILVQAKRLIQQRAPELKLVIPVADGMAKFYQSLSKQDLDGFELSFEPSLKIMRQSVAALVASGTATLECALCETPQVVFYRLDGFSYRLGRLLSPLKQFSLLNLVAGYELASEFLQTICIEKLVDELMQLTRLGSPKRQLQLQRIEKVRLSLSCKVDYQEFFERCQKLIYK